MSCMYLFPCSRPTSLATLVIAMVTPKVPMSALCGAYVFLPADDFGLDDVVRCRWRHAH